MQLVNPLTSFSWDKPLDIHGLPMLGLPEKQGWAFSRHGWLAAQEGGVDADKYGSMIRRTLRPLSKPTLDKARKEFQDRTVIPFPRYFIIEPSATCNRRCPFCPILVTNRHGFMSWRHFTKLMDECHGQDVYGLSLYQLGESFLWRDKLAPNVTIANMVNFAKTVGGFRAVNISTNGDVDNLHLALECDLDDLIISIDGTTAEVYNANRPSTKKDDPLAFERTIERVQTFLNRKAALGQAKPWVRLQIINKENTRDQVLDFIRQWITVPGVDDVLVKNLDSMRPWLGSTVVGDAEDSIKAQRLGAFPCQHIYAVGSMTADGRFNACCHDALTELTTQGCNIDKMTFADWWNGDYLKTLRGEHNSGHFRKPCAECRERDTWLG